MLQVVAILVIILSSYNLSYSVVISKSSENALVTLGVDQEYKNIQNELAYPANSQGYKIADSNSLIHSSDITPSSVLLRRTKSLLELLKTSLPNNKYQSYKALLIDEEYRVKGLGKSTAETAIEKASFSAIYKIRRSLALSNPLINFDTLLFITNRPQIGLIQSADYGYSFVPGGGLYILTGLKSNTYKVTDILENATVQSGRLKGTKISKRANQFKGAFNSADVSFDGKMIAFSWVERPKGDRNTGNSTFWKDTTSFHLFTMNVDGSDLKQISDGAFDDYHPCFTPAGRIVFISNRNGGYARCNGEAGAQPCGLMETIKPDGSDRYQISFHETSELHPSVDNTGNLTYTRWDYVDRDWSIAHHLWHCGIDGTDPRSYHGNYPLPHSTLTGSSWLDGRKQRPWAEFFCRAIPGTTSKYLGVAGRHHKVPGGPLIIINTAIEDDNKMSQVTMVTPSCLPNEHCINEFKGYDNALGGSYDCSVPNNLSFTSVWPLSENFYIVSNGAGIYLIDKLGNRELIYNANFDDGLGTNFQAAWIMPLRAKKLSDGRDYPKITTKTWQGERKGLQDHKRATIKISNIYESDLPWPPNTKIKSLRIIQILQRPWGVGKTDNPRTSTSNIGYSSAGNARVVLGTVPVESDGSAYFEAPIEREIYFQALDSNGLAIQSMRSGTYVHPGEQMSCFGCHESKWKSIPPSSVSPIAHRREPSKIIPDVDGSCPFNFYRLVQPVLNAKCAPCHNKTENLSTAPRMSYGGLGKYAFYFHGSGACEFLSPLHGGSRSIPGQFGAIAAPMFKSLNSSHHGVSLTKEEFHRITLWLDCNSNERGDYHCYTLEDANNGYKTSTYTNLLKQGKVFWPEYGTDSLNPTGIELFTGTKEITTAPQKTNLILSDNVNVSILNYKIAIKNNSSTKLSIKLYNIMGRTIISTTLDKNLHINLPKGKSIYLLQISNGKKTFVKEISVN